MVGAKIFNNQVIVAKNQVRAILEGHDGFTRDFGIVQRQNYIDIVVPVFEPITKWGTLDLDKPPVTKIRRFHFTKWIHEAPYIALYKEVE